MLFAKNMLFMETARFLHKKYFLYIKYRYAKDTCLPRDALAAITSLKEDGVGHILKYVFECIKSNKFIYSKNT